jgi:hypothetical protein
MVPKKKRKKKGDSLVAEHVAQAAVEVDALRPADEDLARRVDDDVAKGGLVAPDLDDVYEWV